MSLICETYSDGSIEYFKLSITVYSNTQFSYYTFEFFHPGSWKIIQFGTEIIVLIQLLQPNKQFKYVLENKPLVV